MKKIIALLLAIFMLLSLCACGNDKGDTSSDLQDNQQTTNNSSEEVEKVDYSLPELVADGEYSVDLSGEQVIYDKNNIKVTYKGIEGFNSFELAVVVENNGADNLQFKPYAAVVNGVNFDAYFEIDQSLIGKGKTVEGKISLVCSNPADVDVYTHSVEDIKCLDLYFGLYSGDKTYGIPLKLIDNNVHYSFTKGQHDHRNDSRAVRGELVYESAEIAVYLEKTFKKMTGTTSTRYYGKMTIVNKTNGTIAIKDDIECRYTTEPESPHYSTLTGMDTTIAPNSYISNEVYIFEQYSNLEMVEIILGKECFYATPIDVEFNEGGYNDGGMFDEYNGLRKMDCFDDKITAKIIVD